MLYKYVRLIILTLIGVLMGLIGYYLNVVCQVNYEWLFWAGAILILAIGGFIGLTISSGIAPDQDIKDDETLGKIKKQKIQSYGQ